LILISEKKNWWLDRLSQQNDLSFFCKKIIIDFLTYPARTMKISKSINSPGKLDRILLYELNKLRDTNGLVTFSNLTSPCPMGFCTSILRDTKFDEIFLNTTWPILKNPSSTWIIPRSWRRKILLIKGFLNLFFYLLIISFKYLNILYCRTYIEDHLLIKSNYS